LKEQEARVTNSATRTDFRTESNYSVPEKPSRKKTNSKILLLSLGAAVVILVIVAISISRHRTYVNPYDPGTLYQDTSKLLDNQSLSSESASNPVNNPGKDNSEILSSTGKNAQDGQSYFGQHSYDNQSGKNISSLNKKTGCISGNCYTGIGDYKFDNGDEYFGEWSDGARTGLGFYLWNEGTIYLGYFEYGKLEGDGYYMNLNANWDIGRFHNGELQQVEDLPISGCLLGNCYTGIAAKRWDNGDFYLGQFQDGYLTGYGRYEWGEGSWKDDWYIGYWRNNMRNGTGEYHYKNGTIQTGTFINNVFQDDL
jgi:hypothetical protein